MILYILGQISAVAGYIVYYRSRCCAEKRRMVLFEALSKIIMIVSFAFLKSPSGVMANAITFTRSIIIAEKKKAEKFYIPLYVLILAACLASGILTYKNCFSICVYIATIISTTATWFCSPKEIQKWGILGSLFYLAFQISIANISGIILEAGTLVTTLVAYIKVPENFCK